MPDGQREGGRSVRQVLLWLVAVSGVWINGSGLHAQPTNAEVLSQLASNCVTEITTIPDSIVVIADPSHTFVRPAVTASLRDRGVVVFSDRPTSGETLDGNKIATLTYVVDGARVTYAKADDDRVERAVAIRLSYTLLDGRRAVSADSSCSMNFVDTVERSRIGSLEDPLLPVTVGDRPDRGWLRRYLEPAVVVAASAVVVYLFFNVRSDRKDNE